MSDAPQSLLLSGRFAEALAGFEAALAQSPRDPNLIFGRACALKFLGRLEEARAGFDRVLAANAGAAGARNNRGEVLLALGRPGAALEDFDAAIAVQPRLYPGQLGRGIALQRLNRAEEALAAFERATLLRADDPDLWFHRALALENLGRAQEALSAYDRTLALDPHLVAALNNRSIVLLGLRRFAEAAKGYERLEQLAPGNARSLNGLATIALHACDWRQRETFARRLADAIHSGQRDIQPGTLLGYSCDPALMQRVAENFLAPLPRAPKPLWKGKPFSGEKIRLAYCSANFSSHAMPRLMAGVFERHYRARFEVTAISFSPDDGSAMQSRLKQAFDRFIDLRQASEEEIAARIAALNVDIAVDLMGLTLLSRTGIFARRPAPVQAQYMGYPGTMGAEYFDYIIADEVVAPKSQQNFYSEKIMALPDTYWVTDDRRAVPGPRPGRAEVGLPEQGFVFCSFNNNWKVNPPIFDIWMRLLGAVPQSLLWLIEDSAEAAANLRREAQPRGVDPARLVFAPRIAPDLHLTRHQLADLFLDTLPYNAHTTASDALWVGVPVVTCLGEGFPGRVAASILAAMQLPELVTKNLADYESLALALARDRECLAALKQKVAANRAIAPLFDTARFTRNLEAAYEKMRDDFLGAVRI